MVPIPGTGIVFLSAPCRSHSSSFATEQYFEHKNKTHAHIDPQTDGDHRADGWGGGGKKNEPNTHSVFSSELRRPQIYKLRYTNKMLVKVYYKYY